MKTLLVIHYQATISCTITFRFSQLKVSPELHGYRTSANRTSTMHSLYIEMVLALLGAMLNGEQSDARTTALRSVTTWACLDSALYLQRRAPFKMLARACPRTFRSCTAPTGAYIAPIVGTSRAVHFESGLKVGCTSYVLSLVPITSS